MRSKHLNGTVRAAANQNVKERDYWLKQLSGELIKSSFPMDRKKTPGEQSMDVVKSTFPGEIDSQLTALTKGDHNVLHIYMTAALTVLLSKYTGKKDIILASPIYKQTIEGQFINTLLPLRNHLHGNMTFKELLVQVKQTLVESIENQNYPIEILVEKLNMSFEGNDFPLFDIGLLIENIHDRTYFKSIPINMIFSFIKKDACFETEVEYNSCLYEKSTIERILIHLQNLLESTLFNLDLTIPNIDILLEKEKEQLLNEFNCTEVEFPGSALIHERFAAQTAKTPDNIAVSAAIDLSDIYDHLQPGEKTIEIDSHLLAKYEKCCFQKNPVLFLSDLQIPNTKEVFKIVKTHRHNSVVMNHNAFKLLDLFDGKQNLKSLFILLKNEKIKLLIYSMSTEDVLEISYDFGDKNEILLNGKFEDFISVIKVLYNNHLLDLVGFQSTVSVSGVNSLKNYFDKSETPGYQMNRQLEKILRVDKKLSKAQVLLLGDTPGMATTGLLYLASYLRRNGIQSFCRFYDHDRDKKSLGKNIRDLLQEIQPEVVAVSMKWFLHIARVLEICKIIKRYSSHIKVVIGGNTASYYPEEIIHNEHIDYLVCGDGEVPLLEICRGDSFIQNCIYKKNGKPIKNPITYIEDETNGKEIYLSHLEEILLSGQASLFGSFFIYTHKGCLMNCLYCGGCHAAHKKKFNRSSFYKRGISQVRRDIIEAKKYTSTFFFDFDAPNPKLEEYCKSIWEGIDLSSHFCILGNLIPPSGQLVKLVTRTFKYVYWNLDIASLSERHRLELFSKGQVKPQPTDTEIEAFFEACEKYDNTEIRVNLIAGLPFFTKQDIKTSEGVLNLLMNTYKCFGELHWARLHAQPGAPVTLQAENFNMHSYAKTFQDFLTYSERNYKNNSIYPGVEYFDYPYVYYNDEDLNSRISKHYLEMNRKVAYFRENKRKQVIFCHDISYRELDRKTNQLARELGEKGVMPGEIVALMVEDPLEVTVGIIGILKAGAAYLPIDPHYPEDRIDYMLKDSNARILLKGNAVEPEKSEIRNPKSETNSNDQNSNKKNKINTPTVLDFEHLNFEFVSNFEFRASNLNPSNLAYLIYTSGSTGQPKGVLIGHTGLVNYTCWRLAAYQYTDKDVTLQLLSYSFDGFCSNFYSSLLSGGTLVMVPGSKRLDIDYIKNIVRNRGVTSMSIVPGIYNALLKTAETKDLENLRFVVLAGEKTAAGIMEKSKEKSPHTRLINEYGPTETTVTAAANLEMNPHNPALIGKPIANTAIYILDPWHNPVPLEVAGELCINGPGVARGYLNNPELTAERFCLRRPGGALFCQRWQVRVTGAGEELENDLKNEANFNRSPMPWGPPGPPCKNFSLEVSGFYRSYKSYRSYIYRTGDQARWLPDGNIEFLGRLDTQVKVRGFRIELEEIENCLLKREDIKEAILVAREVGQGENYLCAYIVSSGDIDSLELEGYLSKNLPPYMIPSSFIRIERIPLTPGGKVDKQALPGVEVKRKYTAPRNNVEEKLAMIWAKVLNLEKPIGIDDDFFELGGQSLKTTVLISKIHKEFNIKIPHADIFKIPTIRGLHDYINKTTVSIYSSVEGQEKKEYYPQSSAQKRLFFLNRLAETGVSYNTPVALKIRGEISKDQFEKVFSILISRHEPLRTGFELPEGKPVQRVHDQVNFKLEYHNKTTTNPAVTTSPPPQSKVFVGGSRCFTGQFFQKAPPWLPEAIKNFIRPFNLSTAPLLRAGLWKLARQEHLFLFDMHHIIADGTSMGILISEFTRVYAGEDLPALRIQYKDFSVWQKRLFETNQIKDQENYWSNLYSDEIPRLNLSTDYPRPRVFNFSGEKYIFELDPVQARTFEEMGSSAGVTLYMNLLAAFYVLLHKYTGQEDIVVGSGIMGRPHTDMHHLIGMFVNSLVMRNYPRPTMTYRRFLEEVKKNCLQAYENQDVQFEDLVEKINPPRDPSRNPIFDVSLIFQDFEQSILTIKNVTFVPYKFENNTSKFDMSLFIYPGSDSIRFSLEYCTALYSRDTIKRLSTHYLHTINQVTKNPDIGLEDIQLLTEEERRLLLGDFNNTVGPYPEDMTLHGLFENQAEKTPDRIALHGCMNARRHGGGYLTYQELNERSDQLALWLLEENVQPETIVGIMAERSLEMIIGILGILKAGSAYLPIDPDYPQDRIDYMLKDSSAKILLKDNDFTPEAFNNRPKGASTHLRLSPAPVTSLAYIIYTSGTTGRPKGVLVKHESIVNTLLARKHEYAMESSHVALQLFSFSFDGFLTGFFTPVISGVKVIMMSDREIKDPARIASVIAGEQVTHFICIPSLYRVIMEALTDKQAASLQVVTLAGERLPADLLEITQNKNKQLELVNEYGVTEAAVMSTINRHQENCRQIKIGKPTRNTRIYILDKRQVLQPIGVPGELCISGIALARGYLNKPELTAEKFCLRRPGGRFLKKLPPWTPRKNFSLGGKGFYRSHTSHRSYISYKSYIYRTGDLARWLSDGNIEFFGRIDHQVKIRGFRIELEEIRHQLLQHEQVRDAVVVDREERSGHRYLCAYIVAAGEPDAGNLKSHLSGQLPGYMVPAHFIPLESIPLTSSGKVDRGKLPPPGQVGVLGHGAYVAPLGTLEQQIAAIWEEIAGAGRIGRDDNFFDVGGNSLNALHIINRLKEELQLEIPLLGLFEYPTVSAFAGFLQREFLKGEKGGPEIEIRDIEPEVMEKTRRRRKRKQAITGLEVAIIGMSCRFPGAEDIERFWENLREGVESLTFLSMPELEREAAPGEILTNPAYVKSAGGILEGREYFDAAFFGYTPLEAELLNPQTRLFYQCCWHAIEHAAYNPFDSTKRIGLYAGADSGHLWQGGVLLSGKGSALGTFSVSLLAGESTLCTRVSYHLNLKGPAVFVQTACSTSLTAIHLACQALLNSESDFALAGGVSLICGPRVGYLYQEGMVVSPDGHCRAFDAEARGTAGGEGCGVVVLKLLDEAVEDGDLIHAVIKSTAINNDGIRKVGYTAPSVQGQAEAVHAALQMARVEPESITYVETHGTGTPLGDPIEIKALTRAFKTTKRQYCAVGSVKTNIGHLGSAAGVAGLIKTVLAMRHRLIPPSLHYQCPNPEIDFRDSPFYVNTRLREWTGPGGPLRAGVSSFGIGGTNAHAVLEEWTLPAPTRGETRRGSQLLLLSARTAGTLEKITVNLAHHFKNHPQLNLADAAYTLQVGRQGFGHRRMLVCKNLAGAVSALSDPDTRQVKNLEHANGKSPEAPAVIFIFSGVGAQYVEMGQGLYQDKPGFRQRMDRCFDILTSLGRGGLEKILYPRRDRDRNPEWGMELSSIFIFILQYSLAGLLADWGITPTAMMGYSFGEYAAACIAGVFSLEEALELAAVRGRLIEGTAPGAMLSVPLEAETLEPLLPPGLSLAVDNGPSCLVSGPRELVDRFQEEMKARKYVCMPLAVSTAVHSSTMDPILEPLAGTVSSLNPKAPAIPYISNVTGQWITADDVTTPAYWTTHMRQTVRFADGIRKLVKQHPRALFIEIGPGHDLRALVLRCLENNTRETDPGMRVINLVKPAGSRMSDMDYLLDKLGRMWLYGVTPDWGAFHRGESVRRIPLPGYPFGEDAAFYPVHIGGIQDGVVSAAVKPGQLERQPDLSRWFYRGTWKRLPYTRPTREESRGDWLVFTAAEESGICRRLTESLERYCTSGDGGAAAKVVLVVTGSGFAEAGQDRYTVDPGNPGDYDTLFRRLGALGTTPCRVLHLWTLEDGGGDSDDRGDGVEQDLRLGFYSLLYLARAMAGPHGVEKGEITVVSSNMQDIAGEPRLYPGKMPLLGPINVIPQEYPGFGCRSLDIVVPLPGSREADQLTDYLMEELLGGISDIIAAYRFGRRWVWDIEPVHPGPEAPALLPTLVPGLRRGGVYLITGGLGKVGLILAEGLFREVGARLILTGRSALPPRKEWNSIAAAAGSGDKTGQRIRRLQRLMEQGAEVLVLEADAADEQQMTGAVRAAEERFGPLNGVIHAAAITDGSYMQPVASTDKAACQWQFRPKIDGTRVLEKVLENKNLDFCLLMSSIASLLGGLGFAVYSAANLFMDGFVYYHNRHSPQRWISVNWDAWGESGDESEDRGNSRVDNSGIGADLRRLAMTPEQGFQVFKRAVSRRELYYPGQVMISTGDLGQRIKQWIKLESLDSPGIAAHGTQGTHGTARPRPHLTSPYREPGTAAEKTLVQIIEEILGYDRVGIDDDFFELGLDSIKIIQIRARLGQKGCRTEMSDFFQYPTVSQLAPRSRRAKPGNKEEPRAADIYPLTPMQEGMFYHSLYESVNTQAYFEQLSYHLREDLDPELLKKSANQLVARHDILRTVFIHEGQERPVQKVLKERQVEFLYRDLHRAPVGGGSDRDRDALVREYEEKQKQRPFDLSKDVLIRLTVLRLEDCHYAVIWSFHHILMDGWCMSILTSEFLEIYRGLVEGRPPRLGTVRPFREYVDWIERQDKAEAGEFWAGYLAGYEEPASIPRKKYPANRRGEAALEEKYSAGGGSTTLEKEIVDRLHRTAAKNRVTLNILFQAVWGIVLSVYSGGGGTHDGDVVFGVVVSGRPPGLEGVENMTGCFINTVPVRVRYNRGTTFRQLAVRLREETIRAEPYHYYSLAEIQNRSPLKQDLLDHFQEFQNYPTARQIPGLEEQPAQEDAEKKLDPSRVRVFEQGNYDFVFSIIPGEPFILGFGYNANVYDNNLMTRLGRHTLRVLEQIAKNDAILVEHITLLSEGEKTQILFEFNRREDRPEWEQGVPRRIENQAVLNPDGTALVYGGRYLTYRQLEQDSRQWAAVLRRYGIGRDRTAAIRLERSPLTAILILAVWKAGGAYIPLDAADPIQRLVRVLIDAAPTVLITTPEPDSRLEEVLPGRIITLHHPTDTNPAVEHPREQDAVENRDRSPDRLAYVIYTSGSTGVPKGVMIHHGGMMNHIRAKIRELELTGRCIVAQNATHTFDISVWQFFTALTLGGRVVIYPAALIMEPARFYRQVVKDGVTILEVVPSYLAMILEAADLPGENSGAGGQRPNLDYLLVTGEEVKPGLVERWFASHPGIKVVNAYGPTEASDDITHHIMDRPPASDRIPIGRPLHNLVVSIVDRRGQLCPVGVKGEIHVAGTGVGRGYLNQPKLTAEKFDHDFKDYQDYHDGYHRSYRSYRSNIFQTGDLGCWREEGIIEFFGRKDHQVKIRGFRIEPGEIERRLMRHPRVKGAVVTALKDGGGEPYLCAYFVPDHPGQSTGDLKDYLSGVLPPYMVPAHFLELEKLPLTASGKVDRRGLPRPLQSTAPPTPPATALERKLVGLWEEVLSLPPGSTGIDDDFFRLGGHSLKAMLLLFKIHQQLDIKLPLAELFQFRTIRSLARFMENISPKKFIPIEAVEKKEYYPLSPAQKRLYILQEMNPAATAYNLPQVHELPAVPGANPEEIIVDIFRQLIRRHESLRTCFPVKDGEPIQRVLDEDEVEFQPEENRDRVVRPFDLTRAPLLRAGIFPANTNKRLLWVDIHHIVTDGISNAVLLNDFMTLAENKTLTPLRIQYKDFSMWRHHLDEKGGLEKQEAYWLKEFAGELPVLDLPLDYTRPVPRDFSGAVESFRLKETTAAALRSMTRAEGVTLYMLLSAFLHILLSKISGGEDIVVGSPVAGRGHIHLTEVMGMFVNTLPLRNFPVREKTLGEFLLEVKQRTLAAFENQDYPFEELVEKMAVHRDLGRNPLFDVLFICETVEGIAGGIDEQAGEEKKNKDAGEQSSKFDMTWHALESGDRLTFSVAYCPALFKKETIQRFIACFERLVSSVLEGGRELKLGTVEVIPAAEKNRVLLEFNDTKAVYAGDNTLDRLFSLRVEQNPDYAALLWTHSVVTYRELSRGARQLARRLRQKGIGPGVLVAVMMERSPEMLIALFAVLRAGGAYLPIDPSFPPKRIKYLIEDSRPALIIIAEAPAGEVDGLCETVQLKGFAGTEGGVKGGDAPSPVLGTDPAYVIYTSGTTGRPRGVMVCHYSVVNRLQWMQKAYPAAPGDVMLQKTPFTFDVSVWELSWWYLCGAAVCLAVPGSEKDPAALIDVIERQKVTIIHFVPSMLGAFLEYAAAGNMGERLKRLRHVFASGEKLELDRVERFNRLFAPLRRDKMSVPQLSNLYGPTEATVDVSYYNCPPGEKPDLVPIGKPIANIRLYVMDPWHQLQPVGITGELCIAGDGLARGYLNRPELTCEKFKINQKFLGVRNPFFKKGFGPRRAAGGKLYKTGDLARWLNNGNIQFLGRMDYQVKVRGNRIELGEIEARLREYPGVKEAVAAVKQDRDGNNYLCAYLVVSGTGAAGEPGQYLSTVLPDYMIPSFFIYLETLPHTPSGKIDRQALPLPDEGVRAGAAGYVPPGTPLENTLAELWREVLGIEKPGIRDNFFRLGGHSLVAIKLAARLKNKGIHLSINEIFLYPTIQGQAQRIGLNHELAVRAFGEFFAADNDPGEPANVPGHAPSPEETWRLLQGQWARWDQGIVNTREVNQYKMTAKQRIQLGDTGRCRLIPLFFHRGLDTGLLQETLLEMIENQGLLRSVFREKAGEWHWVEFSAPSGLSVPFVDLTDRPPGMRDRLMREIVHRMLKEDFGQNSLLYRVVCFKRDIREYVLMIVIDHIIYDGMSRDIITREIAAAYSLKEVGQQYPRIRPRSYADYAAHILQGPRGIGPAELIEMFNLKAFAAAEKELERTVLERDDGSIKLYTHEIPFPAGIGEERAWEFAFWFFVLFTGRALGMRELPLKIATYGRRCGEKTFFDTVGDFADLVPVLVPTNGKNSRQMAGTASERIERASRHSINFLTLVSEPSLQEKWREAICLLMAGKSAAGDAILVFNLVGKATEDRIRGFKPGVVTLGKEMKRSAIHAEIYYGPGSLYIYLTTSLNIEAFGDIGGLTGEVLS